MKLSALTRENKDEYSAQLTVGATIYYRCQCAEIADRKASAGNKPAVVRWRFLEAERKRDSHCESCALSPANQAVPTEPPGLQGSSALLLTIAELSAFGARNSVELY